MCECCISNYLLPAYFLLDKIKINVAVSIFMAYYVKTMRSISVTQTASGWDESTQQIFTPMELKWIVMHPVPFIGFPEVIGSENWQVEACQGTFTAYVVILF